MDRGDVEPPGWLLAGLAGLHSLLRDAGHSCDGNSSMSRIEETRLAARMANRHRRARGLPPLKYYQLSGAGKRKYLAMAHDRIKASNKKHEQMLRDRAQRERPNQ